MSTRDPLNVVAPHAHRLRRLAWGLDAVLCVVVGLFSFRYLLGIGLGFDIIEHNALKFPWLLIHVAGAATAIAIGPFQFLASIRRRRPSVHRWLGRTYAVCCLVGAISGLVLAFGAAAGPVATAGFGLLAVAWWTTTVRAWRAARRRAFGDHRAWMIRSFALTNTAVTLRVYLAVLPMLPLPFLPSYRAISFLCWVPNLIAAELFLRRRRLRT